MLLSKIYADATHVDYEYLDDGRLYKRKWARTSGGGPLTSEYLYYDGTGELEEIVYFDSVTTPVTFTYDRLGRTKTAAGGGSTQTFVYRNELDATKDFQLHSEASSLHDTLITRAYGTQSHNLGKDEGFDISRTSDHSYDSEVIYEYSSTTGRLDRIFGPGLPGGGVKYTYAANSDLLDKHEFVKVISGVPTTVASTTFYYEGNRDLLTAVENKAGAALTRVSQYIYFNDGLGRRTAVVNRGPVFDSDPDGLFNQYQYNTRSELERSRRYMGPFDNTNNPVTAEDFAYVYDNIGNRESYTVAGGTPTTYDANELNQYDSTDDPMETFQYDADGNLIEDDDFEYTWDAENRLIRVAPANPTPPTNSKKLEFTYDYMSRRTQKKVYNWDGAWQLVKHQKFVYDRWNLVRVLDGLDDDEVDKDYTWGLDLSRTIHGAGGIGGLLGCWDPLSINADSYWYFYDANGNVGQVVKDDTGYPTVAHYEYDPYGNTITSSGTFAAANPFRFSTKWWDEEIGLFYYGYRYYDPRLGRWLNRDPIEENGGLNLLAFVTNSPLDQTDPNGLCAGNYIRIDKYACVGFAVHPSTVSLSIWTTVKNTYYPPIDNPLTPFIDIYVHMISLSSGQFSGFNLWQHQVYYEKYVSWWGAGACLWGETGDYWFNTRLGNGPEGRYGCLEDCKKAADSLARGEYFN